MWAFGGHLSPSHQILFDYWLRSKCRKLLDEELPIPEAGNVSNLLCICACVSVCVNVLYVNGVTLLGNQFTHCELCNFKLSIIWQFFNDKYVCMCSCFQHTHTYIHIKD